MRTYVSVNQTLYDIDVTNIDAFKKSDIVKSVVSDIYEDFDVTIFFVNSNDDAEKLFMHPRV